jgi:exonuclease III
MIGALWNVRGLNKEGWLQCITDFVSDNKLDFVGFQETKKDNFQDYFLNYVHRDFNWKYLLAEGTAGGILFGFNERKFDVLAWQLGKYSVASTVRNCLDNFTWRLISLYGSPYNEGKVEFITDLGNLLENWDGPTVVGGDFNLVCNTKEKSSGIINHRWTDLFLDWINKFGLIELKPYTRSFT